jgi:hypothetical protein
MFEFEIKNLVGIEPTKDKYMIDMLIYDNQLNTNFTYMYQNNESKQYIGYITFTDQSQDLELVWNIEPNVNVFENFKEYNKINVELQNYCNKYHDTILKLAKEKLFKTFPHLS